MIPRRCTKTIFMVFACLLSACQNSNYVEEQSNPFSAEWANKGSLMLFKTSPGKPKEYGFYFGIYFYAEKSGILPKDSRLTIVQEVLFVEGPAKNAKENVWYIDVGSDPERIIKYNLDISLAGVLTGEYGWDRDDAERYRSSDFPIPIVSTAEGLKTPRRAHWKFKTCLLDFDKELAQAAGRWRDGITTAIAVINWEIKAEMWLDPKTGEPNFSASVYPEKPAITVPKPPYKIQWRPMPNAKIAHKMLTKILTEAIKLGPRTGDSNEINIWHYQYGHLLEKYPRPFWDK